jgi:cytochrome c oxidase assembly factor CtaG
MAARTVQLIRRSLGAMLLASVCAAATGHVLSAQELSAPPIGWTYEPWVVTLMLLSLGLYMAGYVRLRLRTRRAGSIRAKQLAAFLAGWLALLAALDSPLDALSAALFSAHMVQHELLMIVVAPLLVLSRPLGVWIWAFPKPVRMGLGRAARARPVHAAWRWLTLPTVAWVLHATALWAWHAPRLFEAALANAGIHTLQHASFLLSALLFWWTIFGEPSQSARNGHAMLSLFTTMAHTGALGALLTLAPGLWYPSYVEPCTALGFDPLQDQQLGGLIMWVPGGLAYLVGGLVVASRWLMRRSAPAFATPALPVQQPESRS